MIALLAQHPRLLVRRVLARCGCFFLLASTIPASGSTIITTFAGNLIPSGTATNVGVGANGVAIDSSDDVYFADASNHTIRKLNHTTGILTVIAGTGLSGFSGDGGLATSAQLNNPKGVAIDSSGNVYIADTSNHRIRKIDHATGNISTIAGTGTGTFGGDGAAATAARVNSPQGVAVDSAGNVYIADTSNNRVRKIDATTGNISTVAGNGTGGYLADNVAATSTRINAPRGVVVDSAGNFYIADTSNNRIRKVSTGGTITTFAGTGTASFSGDGGAATSATIRAPQALTLDSAGNMYIADTTNHRIRKINTSGVISTLTGTGSAGYGGDGGIATSGQISSPAGIAVDSAGNVYIGDTGDLRLRKIDATSGNISTAAGTGNATFGGDGGQATSAQFTTPQGIAIDIAGNLYLSDSGTHRIRKMTPSGVVTTIAGTGVAGYSGDGGPATSAKLNTPLGIALDGAGNLYIADGNNNRIRKVDTSGVITTFAGNGTGSFGGDSGAATSAQLFAPFSVAVDGSNLYIADTGNNRIRVVDAGGTITTVAGDGTASYGGDGGPATSAQFNTPIFVLPDGAGNLYVADYSNGSIRKVVIGGNITTVAGNGANGYGGDGGLATSAQLNSPRSVGIDGAGNLYITDTTNHRLRKVDTSGIITTIAGTGTAGFSGDGGPPASAQVSTPQNIKVLASGVIYLADSGNRRFRLIADVPPVISSTLAASATYGSVFGGYSIIASYGPTSFNATGLPTGLSLNTSTGAITGTPAQSGVFNVSLTATNGAGTSSPATLVLTVAKAALTVSGVTANNKVYDRSTTASLATTAAVLNGVLLSDVVSLDATSATATFGDATVANGKSVTVAGLALSGGAAINYTLTQPTGLTANITAKGLTVSGVTASDKVYDHTTTATLGFSGAALVGVVSGDAVTLDSTGASGAFADTAVGNGKSVTVSGLALSGAAGNYTLTQPTGVTANITKKALTVSGLTANNKIYDGTFAVTLSGTAALSGVATGDNANVSLSGTATGAFGDANVGTAKSVTLSGLSITGASAGDYTFSLPSLSAAITVATATVSLSNLSATYDGATHTATATTTPSGLATTVTYAGASTLPTNAGNYVVVATVTDANFTGSASGTLVIDQASQTITFAAPTGITVGSPIALTATSSSGLPVTFSVVSGSATVTGSAVTLATAGPVVVRASQSGNANYLAATPVDRTLSGAKLAQTISFAAIADRRATDPDFALSATASSGLPVSFTITSGPAILSGSTVMLTHVPGAVTITASQAGDATYAAAPSVSQTFTVAPIGPLVYFGITTNTDTVAFALTPDGTTGSLIAYLNGTKEGIVCNFTVGGDGTFNATGSVYVNTTSASGDAVPGLTGDEAVLVRSQKTNTASAATASRTFSGRVSGGVITGSITELGLGFSATLQPPSGPTSAIAGYYAAPAVKTATGTTYTVVGTQGQAFALVVTQGVVAAGSGNVDTSGAFSISTPQSVTLTGAVDPATTTVTGSVTLPNKVTQSFAGLNSGVVRTDRLINLSARSNIGTGDNILVAGFVVSGSDSKTVLLRAVGPTLTNFGVSGVLANPTLKLFDSSGKLLSTNDDWGGGSTLAASFAQVGAFALPATSSDAALLVTLAPGSYTMQVASATSATGIAIAEIYDASAKPNAEFQRLVNISTRGNVGSGDSVLVGGFSVTGNSPKRVIVRGIGPTLAKYHVSGVLPDPMLRLYDAQGQLIAMNDNWETPLATGSAQTSATASDIVSATAAVGAFPLDSGSKDAVLIVTLAPGAYTAQISSAVASQSGVALVEIYEIP